MLIVRLNLRFLSYFIKDTSLSPIVSTLRDHKSANHQYPASSNPDQWTDRDSGVSRSMVPVWGLLNLQKLPDFAILLPQTLRMPYSLLVILDFKNNFSIICDAKNSIKKTSKKVTVQ